MKIDPAIVAEILALRNEIGTRADVFITLDLCRIDASPNVFRCGLYPEGMASGRESKFWACDDLADFIPRARAWWAEHSTRIEAGRIRKMALAVLDATIERGECLPADLRARHFSDAEIESLGALACEEAGRLAGSGSFSIADGIPGNRAPVADGEGAAPCPGRFGRRGTA